MATAGSDLAVVATSEPRVAAFGEAVTTTVTVVDGEADHCPSFAQFTVPEWLEIAWSGSLAVGVSSPGFPPELGTGDCFAARVQRLVNGTTGGQDFFDAGSVEFYDPALDVDTATGLPDCFPVTLDSGVEEADSGECERSSCGGSASIFGFFPLALLSRSRRSA